MASYSMMFKSFQIPPPLKTDIKLKYPLSTLKMKKSKNVIKGAFDLGKVHVDLSFTADGHGINSIGKKFYGKFDLKGDVGLVGSTTVNVLLNIGIGLALIYGIKALIEIFYATDAWWKALQKNKANKKIDEDKVVATSTPPPPPPPPPSSTTKEEDQHSNKKKNI